MADRKLPELLFPSHNLKIISQNDVLKIYDPLRRIYLVLTPEEYVRQSFVDYLIKTLHYPVSLMANEVFLTLNDLRKRCDTVVYDQYAKPWAIVEYKAPYVEINEKTFEQIIRYNIKLKAKYLILTNGLSLYCCETNYLTNSLKFLTDLPPYL